MAIYHLHVKNISRGKGQSAIASAAYRRASKLFNKIEERYYDYTKKSGVIHSEITIPDNAPAWIKELVALHQIDSTKAAEELWNAVEASEKRSDSRLAKEFIFALPIELTPEQNIHLSREFVHDQVALRGMIADWNVHWDEGNPHVHVMLSTRQLVEGGFGLKVRQWNSASLIREWREQWSEYANFHLRLYNHNVSIDHRSYADQGIDLIPSVHVGKAVTDMSRRGIHTQVMKDSREIHQENLSRIAANPKVLFKKMSSQRESFTAAQLGQELGRYVNDKGGFSIQEKGMLSENLLRHLDSEEALEKAIRESGALSPELIAKILRSIEYHESVFTERVLAKAVTAYTDNAELFSKAILEIKQSSELIFLGFGEDGRERFTTKRMFGIENNIQQMADEIRARRHIKIKDRKIGETLSQYQISIGKELTAEQLAAVEHVLKNTSISCIVGRAGTGKSFSLGAANAVWKASGLKVYGVALSGVAAAGLHKDSGIRSQTIELFKHSIQNGFIKLGYHDVVVMDEAGMTDSVSMEAMLKAIHEAKAKLVLVGDHAQLQPVGPGASFRALIERLGFAEIQTVYRQNEQWQRDATIAFSTGRVAEGLEAYQKKGFVHIEKTERDALFRLVEDWVQIRKSSEGPHEKYLSEYLVLAYRNEDVNTLNSLIRQERVVRGEISEGYSVPTAFSASSVSSGMSSLKEMREIKISEGDRIIFFQNYRKLGVRNGYFATIKNVNFSESGKVIDFAVVLDINGKEVQVDPSTYQDYAHAYAVTTHKAQGATVDHSFVYAGGTKGWDRCLSYVSMSRHRETCHIYADESTHTNFLGFTKSLSRFAIKDSLLDFPLSFATRRGIENPKLSTILPTFLAQKLSHWKDKLVDFHREATQPEAYWREKRAEIEREEKKEEYQNIYQRREDAKIVATYVDANRAVGQSWQVLKEKLHRLGLSNMSYEKQDFEIISTTHEYQMMQSAVEKRDVIAFNIFRESVRYQKAIEIHGLSSEVLQKQSLVHQKREVIKYYVSLCESQKIVLRDRVSLSILQDIKGYYPYLKAQGIETATLKKQAITHLRRSLLGSLSIEEREAFRVVERYQGVNRKVSALFNENVRVNLVKTPEVNNILQRDAVKELICSRDKLAYQIMQNISISEKALNFFHIGKVNPLLNQGFEKSQNDLQKQAENRWAQLQRNAARYAARERIEIYVSTEEVIKRGRVAIDIIQDTKGHYGAMLERGVSWKEIYTDIRVSERIKLFESLDENEKKLIRLADRYQKINRRVGKAWAAQKDITLKQLLASKRDSLASKLFTQKELVELHTLFDSNDGEKSHALIWLEKNHRLDFEKIERHAQRHYSKSIQVGGIQDLCVEATRFISHVIQEKDVDITQDIPSQWKGLRHEINEMINPVIKNVESYSFALSEIKGSVENIRNLQNTVYQFEHYLSLSSQTSHLSRQRMAAEVDSALTEEEKSKVARALRLESMSRPIKGTLAERYLREHRGIKGTLPESYRYLPSVYHFETGQKHPALIVISKTKENETRAVQVIYLDPQTANKIKNKSVKLTYGLLSKGEVGVLVSAGSELNKVIAVAEGPETALSIKEAYPEWTIYAALGSSNFGRIPLDESKEKIIFCADNDGVQSKSQQQLYKAAQKLSLKNIDVWQVMPSEAKQDFNDVLKLQGVEAVKEILNSPQLLKKAENIEYVTEKIIETLENISPGKDVEKIGHTGLSLKSERLIVDYIDAYLEFSEASSERMLHLGENKALAKTFAQKAHVAKQEMGKTAEILLKRVDVLAISQEIQKSTSFDKVPDKFSYMKDCKERLLKNGLTQKELYSIIKDISKKALQHHRAKNLNQDREHSEGQSY